MKKHRIWNIFALFVLLLSTCGILVSAFHVTVELEPAQPVPITDGDENMSYERCALCGGQVRSAGVSRTAWRTDYYLDCTHGDQRVRDKLQRRTVITAYACGSCDYGYDRAETQERVVCLSQG